MATTQKKQEGNIWMTQKALAELYQVKIPTINEHIKNIIGDGELSEEATIRNYRIVQDEGEQQVERGTLHYSFEMVLTIGYRVRSRVGVHFRNWATSILREYVQKGFAMNDERLKNPKPFGTDYFDELLERIREIRASEARFYRKIKAIYTTSVDYNKEDERAQLFSKRCRTNCITVCMVRTMGTLIMASFYSATDNDDSKVGNPFSAAILGKFAGSEALEKKYRASKEYLEKSR